MSGSSSSPGRPPTGDPQKPDDPAAYLVDQQGHRYDALSSGQPFVWNQQLQPGERQNRMLTFEVPSSSDTTLFLAVTEGGFPSQLIIGDNNSPFHAKTEFQLFPS